MNAQSKIREANFAVSRGLYDAAEAAFQAALADAERARDSSLCAEAQRGLAGVYLHKRQYESMAKASLGALAHDETFWGPESQQIIEDAYLAAEANNFLGNHEMARDLYHRSARVAEMYYGPQHKDTVMVFVGLLSIAIQTGRLEEVAELHRKLLPVYKNFSGGENWPTFIRFNQLLEHLRQQRREGDIEELIKGELSLLEINFLDYPDEIKQVTSYYQSYLAKSQRSLALWQIESKQSAEMSPAKLLSQAQRLENAGNQQDATRAYEMALRKLEAERSTDDKVTLEASRQYLNRKKEDATAGTSGLKKAFSGLQKMGMSSKLRGELPKFMDTLVAHLQAGSPYQQAIMDICAESPPRCPALTAELQTALEEFKLFRKPIPDSMREIGQRYGVDELCDLGASLAMAERSKGSASATVRQQCMALRDHIKASKESSRNMFKAFKWF